MAEKATTYHDSAAANLRAAVDHLHKADPVLARVIDAVGPCQLQPSGEGFAALLRSIMFQQLAGAAARAILNRFLALYGNDGRFPTPEEVIATPDDALRSAGLSRQKLGYLRDLAEQFATGAIDPAGLADLSDEEVIGRLTEVKGIGRWTAEMFLIFSLGRLDVLPVDDLGFRKGVQQTYSLPQLPSATEIRQLAEQWRPYRSLATWYLWRSLGVALPAAEGLPL